MYICNGSAWFLATQESKEAAYDVYSTTKGLDLEFEADVQPNTPEPALYETVFLSTHKGPCRASCFNTDGMF